MTGRRLPRAVIGAALAGLLAGCAPDPGPRMVRLVPVAQSPLDQTARQSLAERAASHDLALMRGDSTALLGFNPPRMAETLAAQSGQTAEMMRRAGSSAFAGDDTGLLVVGRLFVTQSRIGAAADGSPFALIPTRTLIAFGRIGGTGAATEVRGVMLAFQDQGQWYFLRLNNARTQAMLTRAYPQFRGVPLPRPAGDR